ncbi:putative nuclease HARBI1 [Saccostrea echinata]|uniref:putative nuclease HARBI1 n=1 Tax=Saccostrea echinata TaxID=191078 RepID=UPI002A7F3CFD|nr:putative nuclease HARBI1 [Saccostrea echinata]
MATILIMQRSLRQQRVFRDRSQPLDSLNDSELISRYRFPRRVIFDMIDGVDEQLRPYTQRSHAIPTQLQVLCTLRYIAKADFFSEVGDIHGVSKSSVSVCIPRVCQALCEHLQNIKFPSSVISLRKMKEQFYCIARFPNVVGAIDGTLIPIKGMSSDDEHIYVSRKNFHALNIQGVVDAEMRFLNINCRFPGSAHDAYIMSNSNIPGIMANLTDGGWLLGDSGFPLKDFLMTPFSNPSTQMEERYNHAHCQTRNVIERAFGVLKSRFRCLHKSGGCLPFTPTKSALVIETCCRLHNKAIEERIPLQQGGEVVLQHNNYVYGGAPLRSARDLRQHIASRF